MSKGEVLGYKVIVKHDLPDALKAREFDIAKREISIRLYDFLKKQPISVFELEEIVNEGVFQDELILRVIATPVNWRHIEMLSSDQSTLSYGFQYKESALTKIKRFWKKICH